MAIFDGDLRLITLDDPIGGVLNINVQQDLYSEWKVWSSGVLLFDTELDVDDSNERIVRFQHSQNTGNSAVYSTEGGSENIGLVDGATYFIRNIDDTNFELYDTKTNAENGPSTVGRIDLTASGLGNGETHRLLADTSKFPRAFRTSGGDDLTPGVQSGAYFFLQNQVGSDWRIISSDEDQTINYAGNIVAEDSALSLITETTDRTVLHLGLQPVTQRVDEILTQTQTAAYDGVVAINVLSSHSGTAFPVGTRSSPVNNITDAMSIASTLGFRTFEITGALTLDVPYTQWRFVGATSTTNDLISLAGQNVNASEFQRVALQGSYTGSLEAIECELGIVTGLNGIFRRCGVGADASLAAGGLVILDSCFSEIAGGSAPIFDCSGASELQMRNYSGGIELHNCDNPSFLASVDLDPGTLIIPDGQGNTAGSVQVRGVGWKEMGSSVGTTLIDRMFDAREFQIATASLVGNADISGDDLTISILDKNLNNLRDLSITVDGRVRRIV